MIFTERVAAAIATADSLLCLGLDPADATSAADAEEFCIRLLDSCLEVVAAVKPNVAFFEQFGSAGWAVLERLRARVPDDRILVVDAKRGDIGNTATAYARACFNVLGADAVTVNPLMGRDSVEPFLHDVTRGVFLLTRTSNPGADDFLRRRLDTGDRLYESIATNSRSWRNAPACIGYVVGATDPDAVAEIRELVGSAPLLAPGVGAQGGDLVATVQAGIDSEGGGLLIPLSRGIAAAPDAGVAAASLRDAINAARTSSTSSRP